MDISRILNIVRFIFFNKTKVRFQSYPFTKGIFINILNLYISDFRMLCIFIVKCSVILVISSAFKYHVLGVVSHKLNYESIILCVLSRLCCSNDHLQIYINPQLWVFCVFRVRVHIFVMIFISRTVHFLCIFSSASRGAGAVQVTFVFFSARQKGSAIAQR